jgi:trimeric autotransporter adhesin
MRRRTWRSRQLAGWLLLALVAGGTRALEAGSHDGLITVGGVPVPGATITATQGERRVIAISGADGLFRLAGLEDGTWTVRVEKLGFRPLTREVVAGAYADSPSTWALTALPLIDLEPLVRLGGGAGSHDADSQGPGPRLVPTPTWTDAGATASGDEAGDGTTDVPVPIVPLADAVAADGLLVHGSINNSAASPFAQPRAFGNNRPRRPWPYTLTTGTLLGDAGWDARPYSFTAEQAPRPDYRDVHLLTTFGGPIRLPGLRTRATFYLGYQRTTDHSTSTQSARVPTALERAGDFSQTHDGVGRAVQIVDPETGLPFAGHTIPADRISPQAAALLGYYPMPDAGTGRFNYQVPIVADRRQDSLQSRLSQPITPRHQVQVTANYQRGASERTTLFGFADAGRSSGFSSQTTWTHRVSPTLSWRASYQLTRQTTRTRPHFAHVRNVSGEAGILGNNQDPPYWGPPRLTFASGTAGLADATHARTDTRAHVWSAQASWSSRGRHFVTFGTDVRRQALDVDGQPDARGTFAFTGVVTGWDLADFLLGQPHTSTIAFGNQDKYFRGSSIDAYVADDWRIRAGLTANVGVRWEYESPVTERFGRLANLDVAPGFTAAAPVLPGEIGPLTGRRYPAALVRPDRTSVQPRLGLAWRPLPASSLIVRAGYGLYRNTGVYQSIATLLAQQPPLATTGTLERSEARPLTLAAGFPSEPADLRPTFAVDLDVRAGVAHTWQASLQRDLPHSLTMTATYLVSKGSRLMQQVLPNTWPAGVEPPCPDCPSGFVYLTSNGGSRRDGLQLQLRRRLHNGFTATLDYTLAKATDNATSFGGASLGGGIAQNWLDLEAEHAPSIFDQRHLVSASAQYTTGARVFGSGLLHGWTGALLRDWTISGQFSAGSGLPLTPVSFAPVRGTGVIGPVRASLTGAPADAVPDGYYLNPAAYAPPAPGEWGTAGRHSVTGPRTFSLDAALARAFRPAGRLTLEWRLDARNVLNRVTWSGVDMSVTSPQFGLPTSTGTMRQVRMSLRARF